MGLLFPAYNAGMDAARKEIVYFILGKIPLEGGAQKILGETIKILGKWKPIFPKFTLDTESIIYDIQSYSTHNPTFGVWFGVALRGAYEVDLIDESGLVRWRDSTRARELSRADSEPAGGGKGDMSEEAEERWKEVWKRGKIYVDVLEQMDSDDDEDSEEGESEEEDEEESD